MKKRSLNDVNPKDMKNYETEVVLNNWCDPNWPICLYDFLYKDKLKNHFWLRTGTINVVDDYFGDENGDNEMVDSAIANFESKLYNDARDQYHNLLIERKNHFWNIDDHELKFKSLFKENVLEFFLSVIHFSADDPFDELIEYKDKIKGFIDIWSGLVENHHLDIHKLMR